MSHDKSTTTYVFTFHVVGGISYQSINYFAIVLSAKLGINTKDVLVKKATFSNEFFLSFGLYHRLSQILLIIKIKFSIFFPDNQIITNRSVDTPGNNSLIKLKENVLCFLLKMEIWF